jgi:hypothetical protein
MLPVADRLAPVQRSQLDLLLTASAIAKSIEHSPDSRRSIPGDRLPDDDAIAIDDAFETLTDWLL